MIKRGTVDKHQPNMVHEADGSKPLEIEDSDDWDSESDGNKSENDEGIKVPPLLPMRTVPNAKDSLCQVCSNLGLTPRQFVVLPSDKEKESKPDNPNIYLGFVEDIKNKSQCPLCRLIVTALGPGVPSFQGGEPLLITMSWKTDGPIPDFSVPSHHIPQIRILRPYIRKPDGQYVHEKTMNSVPEITMLANDSPTQSKTFFVRVINDQIDFGMVRNWLSMCKTWHGSQCDKSGMLDYQLKDPTTVMPHFRLIDVVNNCIVPASFDSTTYVTLSYVWGTIDVTTILRLLKQNISQLEKPGALTRPKTYHRIPVTIRDAMQVVRKLHMRYLWVDSLCIIQDDDAPGGSSLSLISKMDRVYGGAYLTIIAATGTDANAGLYGVRPGTRGTTQSIEEVLPGLRLAFRPKYQDYTHECVYFDRGWTRVLFIVKQLRPFQEQKFTKRSLLFIGGQVIYRCMRAEQWREDVVVENRQSKYGRSAVLDRDSDDIRQYEELIQTYTGLSLTRTSDIYHAFAGITGFFNAQWKVHLCHGIPDAYFDWFLLWTSVVPQKRREGAPSWSWSGWFGKSSPNIGNWYGPSIKRIRKALRQRTWIIWYQRKAHNTKECNLVWTPQKHKSSSSPRNFYGSHVQSFFPFDCSQTRPTHRKLAGAPEYFEDSHNPNPGSGFLQFWTVCLKFKLDKPVSKNNTGGLINARSRVGIFGLGGRELGVVFVNPEWSEINVPKVHDFILLCEGRDEPAQDGRIDDEKGWKYKMMLIEWHGDWAERVSLASLEMIDLDEALGMGPEWREIILG